MIDGHLPLFHFSEAAAVLVSAPPERVYAAIGETTLDDVPAARRALRLLRWFSRRTSTGGPLVNLLEAAGFTRIDERPGSELVLGAVVPRALSSRDFRERVLRGEPALVVSIHLDRDEASPSTRLAVELRASIPDEVMRRRYAARAELARLAIGRMLRDAMSAVKRRAERTGGDVAGDPATRGRDGA